MKTVDLRKVLSQIRFWDALHWDGAQGVVLRNGELADPQVTKQLVEALKDMSPIVAYRESYRKTIIVGCTKAEAVQAILLAHVTAAAHAVDRVLAAQSTRTLEEVMHTASTPAYLIDRIAHTITARDHLTARELEPDAPHVDDPN